MQSLYKKFFPIAAPFAIILLSVVLFLLASGANANQPGSVPTPAEIEERYGIRFTTITLTADTGMIDLRYKVLDVGKAKNFGHYTETTPMIINQEDDKPVEVAIMGFHNHRVEIGRTYYLLYRNTANAIARGDLITIKIDNLEIKDIIVR